MPALAFKPRRAELAECDLADRRRNVLAARFADLDGGGECSASRLVLKPRFWVDLWSGVR